MNYSTIRYENDGRTLFTVMHHHRDGDYDLSAENPCESLNELREFIRELHAEGFYTAATRDALLNEADELDR